MKNQFYLFILIASLAICGAFIFRPNVVDRALGLFGLQNRVSVTSIAPEWDSLAANTSANDLIYNDDSADGFAVAGPSQTPLQPMFGGSGVEPFQQYDNQFGNSTVDHAFDEGVAVSGTNGNTNYGAMPDFSSYSALPSESQSSGFAEYGTAIPSFEPSPITNGIAIQFGGPASPNPTAQVINDYAAADFSQPAPPMPVTNNITSFAGYTIPNQAASQPVTPAGNMSLGDMSFRANPPVIEASVVMPDPQYDTGFADYRPPLTTSELDARIIPPIDTPPMTWGTPANSPVVDPRIAGIAQPIVTQDQIASNNAVIPVQGVVVPTTPVTYPAGAGVQSSEFRVQSVPTTSEIYPEGVTQRFQGPQFETPQSGPVMRETPLYVPPQGNAGIASMSQPVLQPLQSQNPQPVAVADATRHDIPNVDRRVQYEPEVITQIETVFATEVLAKVGSGSVIMTCDILADVRERLDNAWAMQYKAACEEYGQKPSPLDERNFKAEGMLVLFEETLDEWIDLHVKYLDMTLNFPGDKFEDFRKEMSKIFDAEIIPKMTEQYGVTNSYDLDRELRKFGTTLQRKKENFLVQQLATEWYNQLVKPPNKVLNYDDWIGYYEQHKDEKYKILGKAKWEELVVFFSETTNEQEAYAKIAELGNRVWSNGEPFAEVAKHGSQGLTADRGGIRDTIVGSLKTQTLEKAVFSLPIGGMSQIIREDTGGDNAGFYIVRVLERRDTYYIPFDRVQGEIEKMINGERLKKEQDRILAEIRNRYPVVKTNNLQQIIHMASEAERNLPTVDSPEYHAQLIAKAERLVPAKKNQGKSPTPQQGQEGVRVAAAETGKSVIQNPTLAPVVEINHETTSSNPEPPKKKTFLQSINPFK